MLFRSSHLRVCIIAVLCFSSIAALAQLTITPNTTLAAESGNNTSASNTFRRQPNGNIGAGNISKLPVQSLLYSGSSTRILTHVVTWFGQSNHMDVGYTSSDPTQIHNQVTDMLSRGISGAVLDWDGPEASMSTSTVAAFRTEAESRNGSFTFAVVEDVSSVVAYAQQNGCDVTQKIIADLNYAYSNFETSTAYLGSNGRPVVFFFGVEDYYVDWSKVRSAVSGSPELIFENSHSFADTQADGGFAWVNINRSNPNDQNLSGQDTFYAAAVQNPSKLPFGAAYKGFNDTLADWSSNRIMSQQCGQTWLATPAEAGKFYSSSNQLGYMQLVTWNDYEEGTEIETGIDNCISVSAVMQGSALTWTLAGSGNENTISTYRVFISTDGQNLMNLAYVAPGTHSLELSQYNLVANTYTLFVKAIGQPSIANHVSPAVTYRPSHQSPTVGVIASPNMGTAPVSVTATVNATAASDATISSTSISFGDGTIMNGPSASHQYTGAGTYTITATATDSLGVSSSATTTVTITASASYGVLISAPASGNVNSQFVEVKASATTPNPPIVAMKVYVDGTAQYSISSQSSIDVSLKLNNGPHTVGVNAWDGTGAVFTKNASINVVAPSSTLTAILDLTPTPSVGPYGIMACTARSTDTNGFVTSSTINFGDGTSSSGLTGLHNYSASGTYTVSTTVTDDHGYTSSTSSSITVTGQTDQPPTAKLSLAPTSGPAPLTVTASTTGSSDPNGTITSSTINFGDGTTVSGSSVQHTYANSGTYTVTATITDNAGLSSAATATVSVGTGSLAGNSAFVTQQYEDFLDRQPDQSGLNVWINQLNSGMSRAQLITDLMGSDEFAGKGKFVAQTYIGLLGRDADYDGFRNWLSWLENGGTQLGIVDAFLNSAEFQNTFGSNLTDTQFVTIMYQDILLRQPDSGGLNAWVGQLSSEAMTRDQVALGFLQSAEFAGLTSTQNRVTVSLLYFDMLRRQPDSGGSNAWLSALNSGTALTAVINSFLNSQEYATRFQ